MKQIRICSLALMICIIIMAAGCASQQRSSQPTVADAGAGAEQTQSQQPPAAPAEDKAITSQELSAHSTEKDCWITYQGKVYDITRFIPLHPGGSSKLIPYCGNSGFEAAALAQHGASKVAEFMLKPALIGTLTS